MSSNPRVLVPRFRVRQSTDRQIRRWAAATGYARLSEAYRELVRLGWESLKVERGVMVAEVVVDEFEESA